MSSLTKGDGPGQFNNAHSIAVDPDGHIYVADRENGRVQWFDLRGTLLGVRTYGGQFYDIVFDSRIYPATRTDTLIVYRPGK